MATEGCSSPPVGGVRKRSIGLAVSGVSVAALLTGCATSPGSNGPTAFNQNACTNTAAEIGAGVGLLGGVVLAKLTHSNLATGAAIAAGTTLAGGLIGHAIDVHRCNLYKIAEANHILIASEDIYAHEVGPAKGESNTKVGLNVQVASPEREFEPGTANLTPHARAYYREIAGQVATAGKHHQKVVVIGHSGSSKDTELSGERARAVARVFADSGVSSRDLFYQGVGNTEPMPRSRGAGSVAPPGANNRIQIVSLPTTDAAKKYLSKRKTTVTPEAVQSPTAQIHLASADGYGFDGKPTREGSPVDIGRPVNGTLFGLIPTANAGSLKAIPACLVSKPAVQPTAIRSLATGKILPLAGDLPQFYNEPWTARDGNSLIAMLDVQAARDSSEPVPDPRLQVYRDWYLPGHSKRPAFSRRARAEIFRGKKAVLYRVYGDGPIGCIDLVDPKGGRTATGYVYYGMHGQPYESKVKFEAQSKK